jgi:uncharacterized protein YcbK (DUF882 family)
MNRFVDTNELLQKNCAAADAFDADRRSFLKHGLFMTAALGFWSPSLAQASIPGATVAMGRELHLTNVHTGERFRGEYWRNGRYLPDAFGSIKEVMRDHRTGERFPIDPRLMDVMYVLQHRLDNFSAYDVFSGYRSEATNARLRRMSHGVARHSLHMTGQACDLNLPGTHLLSVRKAACSLRCGGVGYYPSSDFVHVDTGRVRYW